MSELIVLWLRERGHVATVERERRGYNGHYLGQWTDDHYTMAEQ